MAKGDKTSQETQVRSAFRWLPLGARELVALSIWTFAFVKLFVYDHCCPN